MARPRKEGLVETDEKKEQKRLLRFVVLVDTIKRSRNKKKSEEAFAEIAVMLKPRIEQISYKFRIPGCTFDDVYQEALLALRYKAVKDYDKDRSTQVKVSPFDKFASLCIRRHLSTQLKSAYQNRKKIWTTSVSLDQDRSNVAGESLCLIDIVTDGKKNISDEIENKERKNNMFKVLYEKLSDFEKEVFILYCDRLSYHDIMKRMNSKRRKIKINTKSVDNALSRIKLKGRKVFKKYGRNLEV